MGDMMRGMTLALNSRRALLSCCRGLGLIIGAMAFASCAQVPKPAAHVQPLPAATGPPQIVAEVQGEVARVLLVRAWLLDSHAAELFGTPSGVGFEFLVLRQPRATGEPSAKPIVGIAVDGRD